MSEQVIATVQRLIKSGDAAAAEMIDALHAEAEALRLQNAMLVTAASNINSDREALRAENGRLAETQRALIYNHNLHVEQLEAARGLLDSTRPHVVELLEFIFSRFGSPLTADQLTDKAVAAVRALEKFTSTPAPEVPGQDVRGLAAFALELIDGAWKGVSFDGGDIQEAGVRHGLLVVEQREESCGEHCDCAEYGFPSECYRLTPALAAHRKAQRKEEGHG